MTFEQAFLKIKEKFNEADASNTSDFAIQVTFTDEDCGGTFYAEVKDGKLAVEPYNYYDNDAVLDITKSALLALLGGRMSLDKVIENGDASVKGDSSKITDWKNTIKKASAKPAAAKKAPAKKPAAKPAAAKTTAKKETVKEAPAKTTKTTTKATAAKTTSAAAKTTTKTASKK
ncbi:MAG: SCP2 sterol-binding domain-containing protein [Firmicutes bacterium]|nr:SCP2 sterol-binding domain-containing protein [Bacillota bacterium]